MVISRFAFVVVVLAACEEHRSLSLKLGPDDESLSTGFKCLEETGTVPLLARGYTPDGPLRGDFATNLVVDFVGLGGGVPGCRGEEILAYCGEHECAPIVVEQRFCGRIELLDLTLDEIRDNARMPEIYDDLRSAGPITDDAPDEPVIVRAVATIEACEDLQAIDGVYPPFDRDRLIGCAYSCPTLLDEVSGDVQLSFDSFGSLCRLPAVEACAGDLRL